MPLPYYDARMGMTPYRHQVQHLFLRGLTYREIAERTGSSVETVKVTIHVMRRQGYGLPYRDFMRR
jgi:DNA-directed RNA polymerase specialized sigma24 family protein